MQNDYGASSISQYIATKWLNTYHEKHISELKLELKKRKNIDRCPKNSFIYVW